MNSPKPHSLLRTSRYRLYWISSFFSNIGTCMQQVAQPWVVLSLTGSPLWVGIDSFALNAPGWLFTLWGGVIADRFDRKRTVLFFQVIQFFSVLALLLLLLAGMLKIWMILAISVLVGSTDALSMPAFQSIIPSLVAKEEIPQAISFNSTQFNLSRVLGPVLGGILLSAFGAAACFSANLVSYLPFFLSVYWIYPKRGIMPRQPITDGQDDGWALAAYLPILRDPRFRLPLVIVFIAALFCSPLLSFTSVIVKSMFHAGPSELGWAAAAYGAGGVLGALALPAVKAAGARPGRWFATALGGITVLVALAPSLPVLYGLLLLGGAALTLTNTSINAALQIVAGDSIRGKVVSLFQLTLYGGIAAGSLLTGAMSSGFGIRTALLANGIMAIILQLAAWLGGGARNNQGNA